MTWQRRNLTQTEITNLFTRFVNHVMLGWFSFFQKNKSKFMERRLRITAGAMILAVVKELIS